MDKYDVIIIGAGPGGLGCAEVLSKSKKSVLILEQNKEIGPKICAGGLTGKDINELKIPKKFIDFEFNEITIHTPLDKDIIKLDNPFVWTIERENLAKYQLSKLSKNIEIRTDAKVTKIEKNQITINDSEKIKFDYLIGADGSNSIVRRYLNLNEEEKAVAIQYLVPTKKYKKIELFFEPNVSTSYIWIFPHKKYASIGTGFYANIDSPDKVQKNFKKWLNKNKIDISKAKYQAFPINCDYQGYKFKNIFLVGDAAGFTSIITGEGIYYAIVSGQEIGKTILNKKYYSRKIEKILEKKKLHDHIFEFIKDTRWIEEVDVEILTLLLKSKFISNKLLNILT